MRRNTKAKTVLPVSELLKWRKVGGGSVRINGRIIKPNEVFLAMEDDLPHSFRDVIVPYVERIRPKRATPRLKKNKSKLKTIRGDAYPYPPEKDIGKGAMHKHKILHLMHQIFSPFLYFEIGVDEGVSIRIANCQAIGVDPKPRIGGNVSKAEIHTMTSDAFFDSSYKGLKGRIPDLVFIDGLHTFDQVIRDFINVEKNSSSATIIVIDDILPTHILQTSRELVPGAWTGDVWKFIPILKEYRPDLTITMLDSQPTGLMVITNLDPKNKRLEKKYAKIVKEWMDVEVPEYIIERQDMDIRSDIENAVRNLIPVKEKKILCFINHYWDPKQKIGFKGKATMKNPKRKAIVERVVEAMKAIPGCDVKICGISGKSLVPIDQSFKDTPATNIAYQSLNLMRHFVDEYDYFINVEDDVLIGQDVINNIVEFDETSAINELLLPNRIEQEEEEWSLLDLKFYAGWERGKKMFKGSPICIAKNHHAGCMIMSTMKYKAMIGMLDSKFNRVWFGGPMASAYAYFHSPFGLYRNYHPTKFHTIFHLDKWEHNQENAAWLNQAAEIEVKPSEKKLPITAICVVHNTMDLFEQTYESFRKFHPEMPLIIVNNSDKDNECWQYVESLGNKKSIERAPDRTFNVKPSNVVVMTLDGNAGHGRGMDLAINLVSSKYALIMDSDIIFHNSPVEDMLKMMEKDTYGVGWTYKMGVTGEDYGIQKKDVNDQPVKILHPYFQLLNVKNYKKYHPYVHHGQPVYLAMQDIADKGLSHEILKDFPGLVGHTTFPFYKPWRSIPSMYIDHIFAGTRDVNTVAGKVEVDGVWTKQGRSTIEARIPYGLDGDIVGAYNSAMESAKTDWVLLLDQDLFLANPYWYTMCLDAINKVGPKVGLITCVANAIFGKGETQRTSEKSQQAEIEIVSNDVENHIEVAKQLYLKYGTKLERVRDYKNAGFFMLVKKEIWEGLQFKSIDTGVQGVDWNYCKRLLANGYEIYRMPGLYVYHRRSMRLLDWKEV